MSTFPALDNVDWYEQSITFIFVATALLSVTGALMWLTVLVTKKVVTEENVTKEVGVKANFFIGFAQAAVGFLVYKSAEYIRWDGHFGSSMPATATSFLVAPFVMLALANIIGDAMDVSFDKKRTRLIAGILFLHLIISWTLILENA